MLYLSATFPLRIRLPGDHTYRVNLKKRTRNFLNLLSRVNFFLIRYESGIAWMLKPDIFVSGRDVTKSRLVLYPEYCIQDGNFVPGFSLLPAFTTHALLPIEWIRPTCRIRGTANWIWIRIRVYVEIFESGKKKLWIQKLSGYVWKGPKSSTLGVECMGNLYGKISF